jgi:ketosteroid isomerase-like protein
MVESERAFAKRCGEIGVRASFLEFFADSAIAFTPEPIRYKEAVKGLPPQSNPLLVRLQWEPQTGGVSWSGDLGFTTGPSVRTEPDKPDRYGQFLSIWRLQPDGTWKVVADIGVSTPHQSSPLGTPFKAFHRVAPSQPDRRDSSDRRLQDPLEFDREFTELCAEEGILKGYLGRIDGGVRLHRENHDPIVGREQAGLFLRSLNVVPAWTPAGGEVSRAGDFVYSYGSYELTSRSKGSAVVEKGSYLHVWRREGSGEWRLIADVTNPIEPNHTR